MKRARARYEQKLAHQFGKLGPEEPAGIARLREAIQRMEAERQRLLDAARPTAVVDRLIEAKRHALAALESIHDQLATVVRRSKNGTVRGPAGTTTDTTLGNPFCGNADPPPTKREGDNAEARCRPPS